MCNSKIKKCFWKVCTYKCIRIVKYLQKIQVRKKCWFCEILKSRNFKVCTHKGLGKMLKKKYKSEISVDKGIGKM